MGDEGRVFDVGHFDLIKIFYDIWRLFFLVPRIYGGRLREGFRCGYVRFR